MRIPGLILAQILFLSSSSLSQVRDLDASTVALYHFNEGQGDTLFDLSGHNLHGVLRNNPTWTDGALSLDGQDDYVEIPHASLLNPNRGSWTVEVVFQTNVDSLANDSPTASNSLISKSDGDFFNGYDILIDWRFSEIVILLDDSTRTTRSALTRLNFSGTADPHHVALVYNRDDSYVRIYLDRILANQVTTDVLTINPSAPLYIGRYVQSSAGVTTHFWGSIDEVRISDIARDPAGFIASGDDDVATSVGTEGGSIPPGFSLDQNYPNPFNPSTTIRFSLPTTSEITLAVFDLLGREVRELAEGRRSAGHHLVSWDGRDNRGQAVANGVYVVQLGAGDLVVEKRMTLLK